MLLERSDEVQNYIEDCEVCCQPIQIEYLFQKEVERFNVITWFRYQFILNVFYVILTSENIKIIWGFIRLIIYHFRCAK